jgi:hypothetical protein
MWIGKAARTVQILGQGCTGTTNVTFNGVAAPKFTLASDTYMTAVVSAGATTGGRCDNSLWRALTSNKSFLVAK